MTADRAALVEKVARAMCDLSGYDPDEETISRHTGNYTKRWKTVAHQCSAAIDIALEEAARVAALYPNIPKSSIPVHAASFAGSEIAAAILALKDKP